MSTFIKTLSQNHWAWGLDPKNGLYKMAFKCYHPPFKKNLLNKDLYFDEEIFFYVKKAPSTIKALSDFNDNANFILMHPQTWFMYTLKNVIEKYKCKC